MLDSGSLSLLTAFDTICSTMLIGDIAHLEHAILIARLLAILSINSRIALIHFALSVPWNVNASSNEESNRKILLLPSFYFYIISATEPSSDSVHASAISIS